MAAAQRGKSLTERGRFWLRHLRQWQEAGGSQAQYCRQHNLSAAAFGWWKRRLNREPQNGGLRHRVHPSVALSGRRFVEIPISLANGSGPSQADHFAYEISLGNQRCLRLQKDFEAHQVAQLLELLEVRC